MNTIFQKYWKTNDLYEIVKSTHCELMAEKVILIVISDICKIRQCELLDERLPFFFSFLRSSCLA